MNKFKKITLGLLGAALLTTGLYSCSNDETVEQDEKKYAARGGKFEKFDDFFFERKEIAMKDFSLALSKAMLESTQLRELIKKEALKKTNNDTEVLVAQIIEETVDGEMLLKKMDKYLSNTTISEILNLAPTLTILVPELPEGSFSAEKWDVNSDVPMVAIRTRYTNDTPVLGINNQGEIASDIISSDIIPGDPILVIKINERIVSNLDAEYSRIDSKEFFTSKVNNLSYRFTDIAFDGLNYPVKIKEIPSNVDPKIADAYKKTNSKNNWQRDYIYYDIVDNDDNGELDYKFQERLMFIRPVENSGGSAKASYDQFTDYSDPQINGTRESGNWNYWTEGSYEFSFNFILTKGATSGTDKKIDRRFSVLPTDLFATTYTHHSKRFLWWTKNWYTVSSIKAKQFTVDMEIFSWDLYNYGAEMLVHAYEIDPDVEVDETITHSSQVATNFGFNFDILNKLGAKFGGINAGGSTQNSQTATVNIKRTYTSDDLGNTQIHFKDPVVTGQLGGSGFFAINHYKLNEYTVGGLKFTVMPVRNVQ